ncbi:hypothetical protein CAPN008_22360 [Capnocytophaga canis]|uniref:hypothetical protein n=1 Tax=Capnocytophaga canis TaxID=1848903 RepID=UPI001ACFAFCC|nr:hypothetical protein [Capnocytophaga canis]GIM62186.1 hypothetical protein CAPN008_22360 [Capnocytophaga canis]
MRQLFLAIFFISGFCAYSQEIQVKPGVYFSGGYRNILSPETEHNFERRTSTGFFHIGPKMDIGNSDYRLSLNGYGTYAAKPKWIWEWFQKSDFKPRRGFGYGASAIIYITPWEASGFTTTLQTRSRVRQTNTAKHGFSFGTGWENMRTFYKIPKDSEINNGRFSAYYGQVGYGIFSQLGSFDLNFRYGVGSQGARFWDVGLAFGILF